MRTSVTSAYMIIPRNRRVKPLVRTIRQCSERFKKSYREQNFAEMSRYSENAWSAMANLFEILRNEEDQGRIDRVFMSVDTSHIIEGLTNAEIAMVINNGKIKKSDTRCRAASLRETLNKIAHFDTETATFRIDNRGAHYIILGGQYQRKIWVTEILVSRLCKNASIAVRAMR